MPSLSHSSIVAKIKPDVPKKNRSKYSSDN